MPINVTHVQTGPDNIEIRMVGTLNEKDRLPSLNLPKNAALTFDLRGFTSINSQGIRVFLLWIHGFANDRITFTHCPKPFVVQMNLIDDFIPNRAVIESFYVPYCNDERTEEKAVLYKNGQNFARNHQGKFQISHPHVLSRDGQPMSLDVSDQYFDFLLR